MSQPIYVVDAFTARPFAGNPAGVCPLTEVKSDEWMQKVASEMRHAETAFVRPLDDGFELRWFTPSVEVDLCGHATLATAHILWTTGRVPADQPIHFQTRSGILVANPGPLIELNFPAITAKMAQLPHPIEGLSPIWTGHNNMDWIVEVESVTHLKDFSPNIENIKNLGMRGLIVTALGGGSYDFASRFFAPQSGVSEDPVTGSAHCCLATFWSARLGKRRMIGYQASERGGEVDVEWLDDRVILRGSAVTVLEGTFLC